ncbi:MAG TPA: Ig-like domain-containing protein, partial [Thermoplasmata archaeon]|nr:Ig-like domain-containing protein [Thermoplasmata archaeon]
GTGVSTGFAAGAAAIVQQYLAQTDGLGSGSPSPALVRAMLVNGARDMPDGVSIPNRGEGWGIIDLKSTIPVKGTWRDSPATLQQGQEWSMKFVVNSSAAPLKISLGWTDPAAQAGIGTSRALMNDLDLHLETPDGGHLHGNWFYGGWSVPGGYDDRYNNLENVFLKNPMPGNYTLRVIADDIDADAVAATPEQDQDFAVVVRGDEVWWGDAARVSIEPKSPSMACDQTVQMGLRAFDVAGKQVPMPGGATWSVSGGWASQWGLFTPALPGRFTVTGKSGGLTDSTTFDVAPCGPVPTVLETSPAGGAVGVGETQPLTVKFSTRMDRASVESLVSVSPSVGFDVRWEESDSRLVLTPGSPLAGSSSYSISVGAGAKSLLGKPLTDGFAFGFSTRAPPQEFITISGTVRAIDGTPIEGATVTAVERSTGLTLAETSTDAGGNYVLRVPAGKEYDLRIRAPGLDEVTVGGAAQTKNVGVTLRKPSPPVGPPLALWLGLGGLGVAAGLGAAALLLGDIVLWALLAIPAAMLMRIRRDEVLDHFVRGQVFGAIKLKPGISYSEIRRELDVANGTLAYHLHVLMREGFISGRREGVYTCFYAGAAKGVGKGIRLSPLQHRIIDEMKKEPGVSQSILAERLAEPMKTVHYNVRRMQQSGFVKVEKQGRVSHCYSLIPENGADSANKLVVRAESAVKSGAITPETLEAEAHADAAGAGVPPPPADEK